MSHQDKLDHLRIEAGQRVSDARLYERRACADESAGALVANAQASQRNWIGALTALLRFFNAIPDVAALTIPPIPQPNEAARERGLLVGAVVRLTVSVSRATGRVVSHDNLGRPIVHWAGGCMWEDPERLTVIRPAPALREPNAEATRIGLYIGACVVVDDEYGEIVGWDLEGDPIVEDANCLMSHFASDVSLVRSVF